MVEDHLTNILLFQRKLADYGYTKRRCYYGLVVTDNVRIPT